MLTTKTISSAAPGVALALALVLSGQAFGQGDPASQATAVVSAAMDRVLALAQDKSLDTEQMRTRIEDLARSEFAWPTMSKLVLARNWRKLTDAQKKEFVTAFQNHLAVVYGTRLQQIHDEQIEVSPGSVASNGDVTVKTTIHGGKADGVVIGYRLRDTDGTWKAIDVIIEGVSLVSNFRAQMREIISSSGIDGLIAKLQEKNAAAASD